MQRVVNPVQGQKTVTAAGTAEALAASLAPSKIIIQALVTNTGYLYIGDSNVDSGTGIALAAGESLALSASDFGFSQECGIDCSKVYLDVDTNGDGCNFLYFQ